MFYHSIICCDCFKPKIWTRTSSIEIVFHMLPTEYFFVLGKWSTKCCVILVSLYILDNISGEGCWFVNIVKANITEVLLLGYLCEITALTSSKRNLSVLLNLFPWKYRCKLTLNAFPFHLIGFNRFLIPFHLKIVSVTNLHFQLVWHWYFYKF